LEVKREDAMTTVVFPDPQTAAAFQAQLVAGVAVLESAKDTATADITTAQGLRATALNGLTAAQTQRGTVAAFVPSATYKATDLAAVRDQMLTIIDRQAAILQAIADIYTYRAAVDQNAVTTDDALLWIARLASGLLTDPT
jgi:hypothetical protein